MQFHFFLINVVIVILSSAFHQNVLADKAINPSVDASPEKFEDAYYPAQNWSSSFDWKLLKVFQDREYGNVLISPISLMLVLALLYEGAGGATESEFQSVLLFPYEKQQLRDKYDHILKELEPSEKREYLINVATEVFLDSWVELKPSFVDKATNHYKADVISTNFSDPVKASDVINTWAKLISDGHVSNLVNANDIEDATMIIANIMYFKGTWLRPFLKNQTFTGGFYVNEHQSVEVDYMTANNKFLYYESSELDSRILRLPYKGGHFSLFIVLPNSKLGLRDLLASANMEKIKKQLYFMDEVTVAVNIPKFKFNYNARFTKILQEFGLVQMFQTTANFPGIVKGSSSILRMLTVTDIMQESGIEVDEEGSVAYSATEVQLGNKYGDPEYIFNASHPFLFFVEEQVSGTILFLGKVENPLQHNMMPIVSRFGDNSATTPASSQV